MVNNIPLVTRTIRFFELDFIRGTANSKEHCSVTAAGIRKILNEAGRFDYGDVESRVIREEIQKINKDYSFWSISRIKRYDIPQISDFNAENTKGIDLAENEGICEKVHFVLFNNGEIIGVETYLPAGTVQSSLTIAINKWIKEHPEHEFYGVNINPLQKNKADITKLKGIKKYRIRASPRIALGIQGENQNSFSSLFNANETSKLDLTLTWDRKEKKYLTGVIERITKIFENDTEIEGVDILRVEALADDGTGNYEEIDLLNSYMISRKQIVRLNENTKAVSDESIFEQIIETYNEFRDDINSRKPLAKYTNIQ